MKLVLDEHGQRRRATPYLQPEDGFEPWAPQPGYFRVLWRAYASTARPWRPHSGGAAMNAPKGQRGAPTRVFV